ncbi:MAG: trehalose-6-phosphate synthase [Candidatus Omnitrophica bacterium]|nr:trehalose-6-phosphate synthase [Candidatus Omnitrophota bacterium]
MWTKENLQDLIRDKLGDYLFIVVSNREPYEHVFHRGKIVCRRSAGGLVTALDPVMQACHGLWIAAASADADHKVTDASGKVMVPEENPSYTLKRIWLTKEEEEQYYYGFSNEALWPLCHMVFQRPEFRQEDWDCYAQVNRKFANAILEEIGDRKAFIWIQDYHLCLLPKYLKEMAPNQLILAQFWHIPWPNYEAFRICPQRREILDGLLANDLLGFHIRYHCHNFLDVIDRELESKIDREKFSVTRAEHETLIRPYPISIDFQGIDQDVNSPPVVNAHKNLIDEFDLAGKKVILGIDRMDYTKGIPERILAIDQMLEQHPELKEKVVFLQKGVLSRLHLAQYKDLNDRVQASVEQVNWKHSTTKWKPIILVKRHMTQEEIIALYRLCDVCVVSSLHDGMNLVAKEFIASRHDEDGCLVLSHFTGSARELPDAVLINPYDRVEFGNGIYKALTMNDAERKKRMVKMRAAISSNNIFRWAAKVISELLKFEFKEQVVAL